MTGVDDRVKGFLDTWNKRRAGELPDPEDARCKTCGALLTDGGFIMDDGDLFCLKCGRDYVVERLH
jgi:hypothetical protein